MNNTLTALAPSLLSSILVVVVVILTVLYTLALMLLRQSRERQIKTSNELSIADNKLAWYYENSEQDAEDGRILEEFLKQGVGVNYGYTDEYTSPARGHAVTTSISGDKVVVTVTYPA
jgi:hypothetical protein